MASTDNDAGEKKGSIWPAAIAGAGLLLAGGLMVFWNGGDEGKRKQDKKAQAANASAKGGSGGKAAKRGGVGERPADDAKAGPRKGHAVVNPRVGGATEFGGMAPQNKKKEPPTFDTPEEELEYYEKELESARSVLEMRERAVKRLPKIKEQVMNGSDPDTGLEIYEKRAKRVEENLEESKDKVDDLEDKVEGLREEVG